MVLKFNVKCVYKYDNKAKRVQSYCKYIKIMNLRLLFNKNARGKREKREKNRDSLSNNEQ